MERQTEHCNVTKQARKISFNSYGPVDSALVETEWVVNPFSFFGCSHRQASTERATWRLSNGR